MTKQPRTAILGDSNPEVINTFTCVKNNPNELIKLLSNHKKNHCSEYYTEMRSLDRSIEFKSLSKVDRAARFIYLTKTCFNGLWRVNSNGQHNVPMGKYKNPSICEPEKILRVSQYLNSNSVKLFNSDYLDLTCKLQKNDFVYLDPPYIPASESESKSNYTSKGFSVNDQLRLKQECIKLDEKGVKFLLSNSEPALFLYKDLGFKCITLNTKRSIAANSQKRGTIQEILVKNY